MLLDSASRDATDFREAIASELKEDHVAATTKPVLLGFQNSATLKVVILLLNTQVNMRVNHVLKLVRTTHLAVLGHLSDDQHVASMLLSVISK